MYNQRLLRSCWLLVGLVASLGCGAQVAEVQGTLKVNGAPAGDIEVYFIPDGQQGTRGPRAAAVTDPAGHFRLAVSEKGTGAVVGHHRVVLVDRLALPPVPDPRFDEQGKPPRTPQPPRIPSKYQTAITTPLRVQVEPRPQSIDLDVSNP